MGLRRSRITKSDADKFLASLNGINVVLRDPISYDAVFTLAETHGLTFYDRSQSLILLFRGDGQKYPTSTVESAERRPAPRP
jgi:hypothetical protein